MATTHLPTRTNTVSTSGYGSDDEAAGDPSSTLGLLQERLQAWKHMCGYLEDYFKAVAKDQKSQSKDSEKILKTLNNPLKEGHHFAQELGGVAGLFENLRANTQAQSQLYLETEQNIEKSVLPVFERLHKEIKAKRKELDSGAGKQSKALSSATNSAQKHIELLGQHTATFDSAGAAGRTTAANDPYVLQRGTWYRLNRQLAEENNSRSDLINVQHNFQQFETHVLTTVQSGLATFNQYMSAQHDRSKAMYGDIAGTASKIDPNFEWSGFTQRNGHILVSPNAPARNIDSMSFPNMNHRATKPLIEGSLESKTKGIGGLGGYKSFYVAVTPAGFLHEFKSNDNLSNDPEPESSLHLPDCIIGAVDGQKFTIKGKDSSGSKFTQKLHMTTEHQFKAHTAADAEQWRNIIATVCAGTSNSLPTSPVSQTTAHDQYPTSLNTAAVQQSTGTTAATQSPYSAHPSSATATHAPEYAQPGSATATHAPQNIGVASSTGHQTTGVTGGTSAMSSQAQPLAGEGARGPSGTYLPPTTNELEPRKY